MPQPTTEELVAEFGEEHRATILEAMSWLTGKEADWDLGQPIDRREYVRDIVDRSRPRPGFLA